MKHEENTDYIDFDDVDAVGGFLQDQGGARPCQGTAPLQHMYQVELRAAANL